MARYPPQGENTIHTQFNKKSELIPYDYGLRPDSSLRHYDMIIPFGWWHHQHPIKNVETYEEWCFEPTKCVEHGQDEGIADMFEWDERVAFDEAAKVIGRIGSTKQEEVQLEGIRKLYWQ